MDKFLDPDTRLKELTFLEPQCLLAPEVWYHVCLVPADDTWPGNRPSYQRLGSVMTDKEGRIKPFRQFGDEFSFTRED